MTDPSAIHPDLARLQDDVVRAVASDITDLHDEDWSDHQWRRIGVNLELMDDGERISTQALVIATRPQEGLNKYSFRLRPATKQGFVDLARAMARDGKGMWTIANLQIERDGRFAFDFAYGPPPRLTGDLLATPLTGFLDRYRAETGEATDAPS